MVYLHSIAIKKNEILFTNLTWSQRLSGGKETKCTATLRFTGKKGR